MNRIMFYYLLVMILILAMLNICTLAIQLAMLIIYFNHSRI